MKKAAGILGVSLAGASLVAWLASSAAGASAGSRDWWLGGGGGPSTTAPEPRSIALLGAGLVALSLYAKKKNSKKA
jgi:hypothetical protein